MLISAFCAEISTACTNYESSKNPIHTTRILLPCAAVGASAAAQGEFNSAAHIPHLITQALSYRTYNSEQYTSAKNMHLPSSS